MVVNVQSGLIQLFRTFLIHIKLKFTHKKKKTKTDDCPIWGGLLKITCLLEIKLLFEYYHLIITKITFSQNV